MNRAAGGGPAVAGLLIISACAWGEPEPVSPLDSVRTHLAASDASNAYSVDAVALPFSGVQCVISTRHDHQSRQRRWLVDPATHAVRSDVSIEELFGAHQFVVESTAYSAAEWANLALCAAGSGASLVTTAASGDATDGPTSPRLTVTDAGPELTFWTAHDNHRSPPDYRRHRVTMDAAGRIAAERGAPVSIGRE